MGFYGRPLGPHDLRSPGGPDGLPMAAHGRPHVPQGPHMGFRGLPMRLQALGFVSAESQSVHQDLRFCNSRGSPAGLAEWLS